MSRTKRILARANQRISLGNAAALLIGASLLSQILGFLRTKLVNANFPIFGPESTDAYFAAFKIPDLFFFTLAAGALGVAFMPFLADRLAKNDRKGVWDLSNSLLNLLAILMLITGVIIFFFAEKLIDTIVAPGLTPEQLENATAIMKLVAFNPFLFTLSGIFTSVQQTFGRFFFYAVAPLFYNISIIASIYLFGDSFGLVGLGIGALAGALLQLAVAIFGFVGLHYKYQAVIKWQMPDFRSMIKQLPPRSLDQGVDQVNTVVETNLASKLGVGQITYYENAFILHTAPILLVGTTIATAAFPRLNNRLAQGRPDLFRRDFLKILRVIIWIIVPIVIVSFFARGYLARLIFSRGAPEIALVFGFFIGAIFFRAIFAIISRWFYSNKDSNTPLYVSIVAIALNIFLAYVLSRPSAYGVAGLALAQSIVAAVEVAILSIIMVIRDPKLLDKTFWNGVLQIISISGFSALATYAAVKIFPLTLSDTGVLSLGSKLAAIAGVTFIVHYSLSILFNLDEAKPITRRLKALVLGKVKV
jgi:putative peptidoglycan lipid II flippase